MNLPNPSSKPSSLAKEDRVILSILEEIEKNPETSQRKIALELGMAVGLVNAFFKRVVSKGFVKIKRLNSRNVRYLLTTHGIYEKSKLTYRYLRSSIQYVWRYRNEVHALLEPLADEGRKKIVIYGSGEEAELAFLAIQELGMEVEAVVDPVSEQKRCLGKPVEGLDWLESCENIEILLVLFSKNGGQYLELFLTAAQRQSCRIEHQLCVKF